MLAIASILRVLFKMILGINLHNYLAQVHLPG